MWRWGPTRWSSGLSIRSLLERSLKQGVGKGSYVGARRDGDSVMASSTSPHPANEVMGDTFMEAAALTHILCCCTSPPKLGTTEGVSPTLHIVLDFFWILSEDTNTLAKVSPL
jgi:hypothetical protein